MLSHAIYHYILKKPLTKQIGMNKYASNLDHFTILTFKLPHEQMQVLWIIHNQSTFFQIGMRNASTWIIQISTFQWDPNALSLSVWPLILISITKSRNKQIGMTNASTWSFKSQLFNESQIPMPSVVCDL